MTHDYSAVVPIMPLQWSMPDIWFDAQLTAMIADFAAKLADDGVPMTDEDLRGLRDDAYEYRAKVRAQYAPGAKRFTDAELAAECHASVAEVYRLKVGTRGPGRPRKSETDAKPRALDQMVTLLRFATLPHYDKDQP